MNILANKNKYLFYLSKLNQRQRIATTLSLLLIIFLMWAFFINSKFKKTIEYNKNLLDQIEQKKQLLEIQKNKCKSRKRKIELIKTDINKYTCQKNSKNMNQPEIIKMIGYAKSSGMSLKSFTTLEELNDKTFKQKKMAYAFSGNINQTISFCKKLKNIKENFECKEITINTLANNTCEIKCILNFLSLKK